MTELINDRTEYLGGSDAAAVLGVSPWRTPLQLYLAKRGEAEPTDEDRVRERMLARGKREEPHIIRDLARLHGIKITKRSSPRKPNRYADPEYPFLSAEIDFEWQVTAKVVDHFEGKIDPALIGSVQHGEVKTMHPFAAAKKIGEEGTDEFPIEYMAQVQHGMMVHRAQLTLVAFGVYCNDPLVYWAPRDDDVIGAYRPRALTFWNEHVLKGVPPAPTTFEDVTRLLNKRPSSRVEATPEILAAIQSLTSLRAHGREITEGEKALKYTIGCHILGAAAMDGPKVDGVHYLTENGVPVFQVSMTEQERVDVDVLRAKYPEIAAECVKQIQSYKFSKPKKGTR